MLFQTPEFAIFLVVIVTLVAIARTNDARKIILLAGSYVFYMWWKVPYVLPLLATTFIDFFVGRLLEDEQRPSRRRLFLSISLTANLGLLAAFKYYSLFFGKPLLNLALPVGISFYTFHTMSYVIDVYRREIPACRSARDFALFITFFPVLVAGPILRARTFLPQLRDEHGIRLKFDSGVLLLFVRGLVKKVLIADNVAGFADQVFHDVARWPSLVIWAATIAFAVQIYCDFSGYSDMARALARLFGLEIPLNFDRPYFAKSPTEFWRRWHISLSTWLRDYLYIPLGGSRGGEAKTVRNLMITMLLGGLWHGASWNFVVWGFLHGVLLTINHVWRRVRPQSIDSVPLRARTIASWIATQYAILATWLIFRVRDFDAMQLALRKFVLFDFDFHLAHLGLVTILFATTGALVLLFLLLHALSHRWGDLDERIARLPLPAAAAICVVAGFALLLLWPTSAQPFLYFQF